MTIDMVDLLRDLYNRSSLVVAWLTLMGVLLLIVVVLT